MAPKLINARFRIPKTSPKISAWLEKPWERYRVHKFLHIVHQSKLNFSEFLGWGPKPLKQSKTRGPVFPRKNNFFHIGRTCPKPNGIYKNLNWSSRRYFSTRFLVDLTKMMSGQNQGTKLSIWWAIGSFCKVDKVCNTIPKTTNQY